MWIRWAKKSHRSLMGIGLILLIYPTLMTTTTHAQQPTATIYDLFERDTSPPPATVDDRPISSSSPWHTRKNTALPQAKQSQVDFAYLATTGARVTTTSSMQEEWGRHSAATLVSTAGQLMPSPQALMNITRSPELLNALQRMYFTPTSKRSLDAITQRGGKVMFKNLAELGGQYATFDALAWLSNEPQTQGAWVLFIAEKHRKAPVEALASLITHEAFHSDVQNSYCEEEHAWLAEVTAWKQFKAQNPTLHHIPNGWFGLVDRLNTIETALAQQTLRKMIRNNPGYAGLQEASPYFRYSPFEVPNATTVEPMVVVHQAVNNVRQAGKPLPVASEGNNLLLLRPVKTW
jgi:hypothetical protein